MTFNPLTEVVKSKPRSRQSFDPAPAPAPETKFDTTTPAQPAAQPRRFSLADLPRYADALYPHLQAMFPHLNDRMYGGWLRGCINDNACLFLTVENEDNKGAVAMAMMGRDPLDPVPFVEIVFLIGNPGMFTVLSNSIIKWAKELGAKEVRTRSDDRTIFKKATGYVGEIEDRVLLVMNLME